MPMADRSLRPTAGSSSAICSCRLCGAHLQRALVDFGDLPQPVISADEAKYRLRLMMCQSCGLVQSAHEPPPYHPLTWRTPRGCDNADMGILISKWRLPMGARVIHVCAGDAAALQQLQAA